MSEKVCEKCGIKFFGEGIAEQGKVFCSQDCKQKHLNTREQDSEAEADDSGDDEG